MDLQAAAPLLLRTGAAGLAWARLKDSAHRDHPAAVEIRDAYRLQVARSMQDEEGIAQVVTALAEVGITPVMVKGWVAAQSYPGRGFRPYGDIDLVVDPRDFAEAERALSSLTAHTVDLHGGYPKLPDRDFGALYSRSEQRVVGGCAVRVPSAEDHLRLLCTHMLAHGAWRPLWLCDIAAALESRPAGFDWDACLEGDRHCSQGVLHSLALAGRLLGARLEDTPAEGLDGRLPAWLAPAVLVQWGTGHGATDQPPLGEVLRRGGGVRLARELRIRWRNPVQATFETGAPYNGLPRWPWQLAALAGRIPDVIRQLRRAPGPSP